LDLSKPLDPEISLSSIAGFQDIPTTREHHTAIKNGDDGPIQAYHVPTQFFFPSIALILRVFNGSPLSLKSYLPYKPAKRAKALKRCVKSTKVEHTSFASVRVEDLKTVRNTSGMECDIMGTFGRNL